MSPVEIPSVMRALVVQEGGVAAIEEVPVPELGDGNLLIKTKAIAINPTDWKHIKHRSKPGVLAGCDFAGEVVKVGPNISPRVSWKVGDRVSGSVHGGTYTDRGSFAEYVKADDVLLWSIPDETSYEDAVTLNVGTGTAVQSLFHPDRLGMVEPPEKVAEGTWVFIYGGSTSVGQNAIQLAHLAGYKVITAASPRSHDITKSLGADAVFDYHDEEIVSKVKNVSGDSIRVALDTFSEGVSQIITVNVIAPAGGKVITILSVSTEAAELRPEVTIASTFFYYVFGTPWMLGDIQMSANLGDQLQVSKFMVEKLPKLIKDGTLKPQKLKLFEGGLEELYKGLEYMMSGQVNAEKVVINLAN